MTANGRRGGGQSNNNLLQHRLRLQQQLSQPPSQKQKDLTRATKTSPRKRTNNGIARSTQKVCCLILLVGGCLFGTVQYRWISRIQYEANPHKTIRSPAHSLMPSCHPHWKVSISKGQGSINDISNSQSWSNTLPITRIYFYHIRKAGGTMLRKYLQKVASHYSLDLIMLEYQHAAKDEEVGSRNDTIYVTNLRDPVSRSVSHFKYDARWDCEQLVRNESFVATASNAQSFEKWNQTKGFIPSECDIPFSFTSCAVNCYIQAFSGRGCTRDNWFTEYNMALERLLLYNMIFVFEKFTDPNYAKAVENFFGVKGFNEPSEMFCGSEAKQANKRVPLHVKFESVLKLTNLNEMDNRLYKDLVTSCWDGEGKKKGSVVKYSFPKVDPSRLIAQENRTVIE